MTRRAVEVHARQRMLAAWVCVLAAAFVVTLITFPAAAGYARVAVMAVVGTSVVILDLVAVVTRRHR